MINKAFIFAVKYEYQKIAFLKDNKKRYCYPEYFKVNFIYLKGNSLFRPHLDIAYPVDPDLCLIIFL